MLFREGVAMDPIRVLRYWRSRLSGRGKIEWFMDSIGVRWRRQIGADSVAGLLMVERADGKREY